MDIRIGQGIDFHKFEYGRKLIIGGVQFDSPFGLKGHSDADVLLHAITDALLGAIGEKDIGFHFPDTNEEFKNVDSRIFLEKAISLARGKGFEISNIDATIICETPKINPFREKIEENIANILKIEKNRVNIKATTTEKMGFIGRKEGIAATAVVLLESVTNQ
ncbi:2-C-methyl-D-erythritol 2,4-cyclodiphosphate synthase [Thermotomaculum hydrothermale]|uniref:2-C-methyl-D-erythritol 2,4-cyclodiphosphate synthase n=1 Tax=Thermotomaculum hydrothermale TaxID=981385 RepID=A0A7R6PN99_9BACT|nr:2-C-methyl-D-erythritol 2,4-cyclodiphosphate synthase [Thermotomaculum hydrothermale]BBB33202.1 2-C-methyl-D-erythritol 2,4-cyclodiphosphate synthase [Thermotomaculum hydrothermale]